MDSKMGITPQSEIHLLNVAELSPDYSDTYYFESSGSQQKFFLSKEKGVLKNYTYIRQNNTIRINKHIDDIHSVNYLMYKNKYGKWYYCFIMNKIYINERVTELIISTDLIQTYLFDFILDDSYVERCHVDRWTSGGNPTPEYMEEDLEMGEHMQVDQKVLYTFEPSYVAVCSNPLGKLINRRSNNNPGISGGGQGGGGVDFPSNPSGDWLQGLPSSGGFRFIKGFEGFASKPYDDGAGFMTIGYGTAQKFNPTEYNQLYNGGAGCTEEQASKVFYNKFIKDYCKPIINRLKSIGITSQSQADALFSVAYNCGIGDVLNNTDLMNAIKRNPKDKEYICRVWENFRVRPDLPHLTAGLKARRRAECDMYFNKYSKRPIMKIGGGGVVQENNGDGWLP